MTYCINIAIIQLNKFQRKLIRMSQITTKLQNERMKESENEGVAEFQNDRMTE
jgi:hypothetical protein